MTLVRSRLRGRYLFLGVAGCGIAVLSLPPSPPDVELPSEPTPFRWDADGLFAELEAELARAGRAAPDEAIATLEGLLAEGGALLQQIGAPAASAVGAHTHPPPLPALSRPCNSAWPCTARHALRFCRACSTSSSMPASP